MGRAISPVPGSVKAVQRGAIVIGAGTNSQTATIAAVDMSKSELRLLGNRNNVTSAPIGTDWVTLSLTNSTTITADRQTNGSGSTETVSWELTEYN